ncbi:ABC transporter permease [Tsuneonella sp. HG094]
MNTAPNDTAAARLSLLQAALVVARRDFLAILLSKAFLFFLLGPVFFGLISVGAASVGRKAAENSEPPVLAVAMSLGNSMAIVHARDRLAPLVDLPKIARIERPTDDPGTLLQQQGNNYGAILTGTLDAPRLIGTKERIERWEGEASLLIANAKGAEATYPEVALEPTATSGASRKSALAGTATAALTLLFLLTMLLAGMVMSNLVEEKANKIIEVLAAAIPMDAVFLGKLFAMLAVSYVGIAVWGGLAGVAIAAGLLEVQSLPTPAVGWALFLPLFLVYFAMAYLLIGSVFLTIGAMAPTVRDVQTLSMPATMLQLAVFFLATYSTSDIGSPAEMFAIAFPFSSPYAMVSRAAQLSALWPHALAIAWQVLWVIVFVRFGARLFRRRVMKSGPSPEGKRGLFRRKIAPT